MVQAEDQSLVVAHASTASSSHNNNPLRSSRSFRNSLNGTISAVIAAVLPNGLLKVQGEKWFQLNRGEEYVRVSGLLRAADISPDNSVSSQRMADARIAYSGTGEIAQANSEETAVLNMDQANLAD